MTPDQVHYGQVDAVYARSPANPRSRLRRQPGTLRQNAATTTRKTDRDMDQSANLTAEK